MPDGLDKRPQFPHQGFFLADRYLLEIELRLWSRLEDTYAQNILARVVDRDIFLMLKKTQLAYAFHRDTAGRQISHRAAGKFQPGVSDVHLVGDDGNPQCVNPDHS